MYLSVRSVPSSTLTRIRRFGSVQYSCRRSYVRRWMAVAAASSDAVRPDVLILTNGPGELMTWVRPVLPLLSARYRLSIALAPCVHASGSEADVARGMEGVERVLPPAHFVAFLAGMERPTDWWQRRSRIDEYNRDGVTAPLPGAFWSPSGAVLFLGGDQFFAGCIARRLRYPCVAYAEWDAMWPGWIPYYAVRWRTIRERARREKLSFRLARWWRWRGRRRRRQALDTQRMTPDTAPVIHVIGDLTTDGVRASVQNPQKVSAMRHKFVGRETSSSANTYLVALLPGSKSVKLASMVPFLLACAYWMTRRCAARIAFVVPLAPGLSAHQLAAYADPQHNPVVERVGGAAAVLGPGASNDATNTVLRITHLYSGDTGSHRERTPASMPVTVHLHTEAPAYPLLAACDLCLTTVGANTAELAALHTPTMVLVPTQQFEDMRAWDGLIGLLCRVPLIGALLARLINRLVLWQYRTGRFGYVALPNRWAGNREVMLERVGRLQAVSVADEAVALLGDATRRQRLRQALAEVVGPPGALRRLVALVDRAVQKRQRAKEGNREEQRECATRPA
ncbi:hypothetical protein CDCA_CDCA07G2250 [Cyanidium caldarium]|uniref:Lipid-A-disaccharide synthase n=1 Tax=Cyanidium caldarium TaxID=2771 RepID=A0AAV9IV89_CYACA|nr:hypothetical protein CDCA_CDCA07G2250 [Cyanidium caldarium]